MIRLPNEPVKHSGNSVLHDTAVAALLCDAQFRAVNRPRVASPRGRRLQAAR
jgi:hypothetical protein